MIKINQLIFEVISHKTNELFKECKNDLKKSKSLEESLFILFKVYVSDEQKYNDIRKLLFDSLYIYTHSKKEKVKIFNTEYYNWIENRLIEIFQYFSIDNVSITYIKSISSTADGMYLRSLADNSFSLQLELKKFITDISKN